MSTFEGKSESGNLDEALQQAIQTAKDTLHTDHLYWKIESIFGESGGYVLLNILRVRIAVEVDKPVS